MERTGREGEASRKKTKKKNETWQGRKTTITRRVYLPCLSYKVQWQKKDENRRLQASDAHEGSALLN